MEKELFAPRPTIAEKQARRILPYPQDGLSERLQFDRPRTETSSYDATVYTIHSFAVTKGDDGKHHRHDVMG